MYSAVPKASQGKILSMLKNLPLFWGGGPGAVLNARSEPALLLRGSLENRASPHFGAPPICAEGFPHLRCSCHPGALSGWATALSPWIPPWQPRLSRRTHVPFLRRKPRGLFNVAHKFSLALGMWKETGKILSRLRGRDTSDLSKCPHGNFQECY